MLPHPRWLSLLACSPCRSSSTTSQPWNSSAGDPLLPRAASLLPRQSGRTDVCRAWLTRTKHSVAPASYTCRSRNALTSRSSSDPAKASAFPPWRLASLYGQLDFLLVLLRRTFHSDLLPCIHLCAAGVTIATVQNPTLRPAGADGSWRDQASVRLEGLVEMIGLCPDSLGFCGALERLI